MKTPVQKLFSSPSGLCDSTASLHLECMRSGSALALLPAPAQQEQQVPVVALLPQWNKATLLGVPGWCWELHMPAAQLRTAEHAGLKKQTTHIQKITRKEEPTHTLRK